MCIQFRWIVPEGTNTQPRILQVRHAIITSENQIDWSLWQTVPTEVVPMNEFRAYRDGY